MVKKESKTIEAYEIPAYIISGRRIESNKDIGVIVSAHTGKGQKHNNKLLITDVISKQNLVHLVERTSKNTISMHLMYYFEKGNILIKAYKEDSFSRGDGSYIRYNKMLRGAGL